MTTNDWPDERRFRRLAHRAGRGPRNSSLFVNASGDRAFASQPVTGPIDVSGDWVRITSPGGSTQPADLPGAQRVLFLRLARSGRSYAVTGLHIESGGPPLAARDLAKLPLAAIAAAFADFPDSLDEVPPLGDEPRRPGRRGHPDAFFAQVAKQYRAAQVRSPTKPVQSMANHAKRNPATIHRWLTRARELGYLPHETDGENAPPVQTQRKGQRR